MAATKPKTNEKPPAQPPAEPASAETKRTRTSFGKDKLLAYQIIGMITLLNAVVTRLKGSLNETEQATVNKAQELANKHGGDPFKAVDDRVAAIQKELTELDWKQPNAIATAKELALELDRQEKRKATIRELIGKADK